jgi:hypothetical protein
MGKLTGKKLHYREQIKTCRHCVNLDLIRDLKGDAQFVCALTKEGVEEFTVCDSWKESKE